VERIVYFVLLWRKVVIGVEDEPLESDGESITDAIHHCLDMVVVGRRYKSKRIEAIVELSICEAGLFKTKGNQNY